MSNLTQVIDRFYHDMAINDLRIMNGSLEQSKLSYHSILYLDIIMAYPGKYTASEIADLLMVARPAVTQKLNALEKLDLIKKVQCCNDKRKHYLYPNLETFPEKSQYNQTDNCVEAKLKEVYSQSELDKFCEILGFVGKLYKKK
ncbi:MarR family transcriptional regulator [Vibrio scophthalmi]|uniref:MarR family winged helix-turn-helix transcriptional regulator n=1 Tax=Vibrio scophthalmi TaxID=45658 RepID=UPI0038730141